MAVVRTQYWNLSTGTVRGGGTGHGESLTDVESYLMPVDRLRTAAVSGWGVAAGMAVRATAGAAGVTVATGTALDAAGNVVVLTDEGLAVIDPTVDPTAVQNVPTVPVGPDGVGLDTAGVTGDALVTVTWREVAGTGQLSNAPVLLLAPWLRLVTAAGFPDVGDQVVLAAVTLDAAGLVTALTAGPRRAASAVAGRLELHHPSSGAELVDQSLTAEIAARDDGGVAVTLHAPTGSSTPLAVDGAGNIAVGGAVAHRVLHVEGSEVHSGGSKGGFSFADRAGGGFVDTPAAGERWVWYARDGSAHLWSGTDRLSVGASGEGGGLDVGRRMRVRQGADASAGIWLHQSGPDADRGFVGMADDQSVGLFGVPFGWGLTMDVSSGRVHVPAALAVDGGVVASGVTVGVDGLVDYPWQYETVGVNRPEFNLRLQSPNSVFVHAQGEVRAGFSAGGLDVTGNLTLRGRLTLQADDAWMRLNQAGHYPNGVHTPWALSCGNLNVGGLNNWTSPGAGNAWFAGDVHVQGTVRLGAGDRPVYIGGNQTGPFMALHDDLWFSDPQNGTIELKDATQAGWGKLKGLFLSPSSRAYKDAIALLDGADVDALLAEALDAQLVWFRWRGDADTGRPRLGVIAEDAPVHLVEEDRTSLSIPEYVAVLLGAVQVLHQRVGVLQDRLAEVAR